jgi:hypothetical protein
MYGNSALPLLAYLLVFLAAIAWEFGIGILASEDTAVKAAEVQGFSDVRVTDKAIVFLSWRGCGSGDAARFSLQAKNSQGKDVDFYVCTGFWKGSTIRTK